MYAPNVDTPAFFENIFKCVSETSCEHVIINGDFNLVLDKDKDSLSRNTNNDKAAMVVRNAMDTLGLVDVWRVYIP